MKIPKLFPDEECHVVQRGRQYVTSFSYMSNKATFSTNPAAAFQFRNWETADHIRDMIDRTEPGNTKAKVLSL